MKDIEISKNTLIVLLGLLVGLGPFTIDMYIPGFPNIADDFKTQENRVAFTMTSYFIGIALGQLVYGPLIDKYGRKKPLLYGLGIYIIAAIGCALSFSIEMMIGLRFFQALGGSAGMVVATAVITDVFKPNDRAHVFSLIMLVMGIAPIIAPSVGSIFITYLNWESIFYFLAILASALALLLFFFLPETGMYMHKEKLKLKKVGGDYWGVFKDRTFFFYTLGGSLANAMIFAYIASASFVFLTYYGVSQKTFSILFAINASGTILGSYLNGLLSKKVFYVRIMNVAALIMTLITIGFALLTYFDPKVSFQWIVVGIFLTQFSIGFTYPNAIAASLVPFTARSGSASALSGAIRMGLGGLITAIIGILTANSAFTLFITMACLSIIATLVLRLAEKYGEV